MADKTWKARERIMARDVGTERIPVTGERHGADFQTELFCYQLKHRKSIPSYIGEWLGGICEAAGRDRVGVLILSQPGSRREDAVVCVRWADWCALTSSSGPVPPSGPVPGAAQP